MLNIEVLNIKMLNIDLRLVFILIIVILAVWRIKKGYENGMVKELVNILSTIVSCVCIALIFFAVSSFIAGAFALLTLCVVALMGIGILFKWFNLIFKPVTAIANISIINGLNKFLGAIFGFGEAIILTLFLYYIFYILNNAGVFSY